MNDASRSLAARAQSSGRPLLARSFRLHRPRGAFCHAGWCQQCRVTLADGSSGLACQLPATATARSVRPGLRRLAGLLAERLPPWFHERPLPALFGQPFLEILRRMSAAPPLPPAHWPAGRRWQRLHCEVLVVGAGLAGMEAALVLHGAGRTVLVVDAGTLGGSAVYLPALQQAVHDARVRFTGAGIAYHEHAPCLGLYDNGTRALVMIPQGPALVEYELLVVATGARDRWLAFPGSDVPGIVGMRAFERLAAQGAIPARARVGAVGDAAGATRVLAAAQSRRIALGWLAGPSSLPENRAVPIHPYTRLRAAHGRSRIRGVDLENAGQQRCDLLVIAFSQPTCELQLQAGQRPLLAGELPVVTTAGATAVPLLVVGEAAGVTHPGAAAKHARRAAAGWLNGESPAPLTPADSGSAALRSADAFVCPCTDVRVGDLQLAIAGGYRDIELLKRRTGAGTGPCQGRLCHAEILACLSAAGIEPALPTIRPPLVPVALADYAAEPAE